jgi:hypothetical protein
MITISLDLVLKEHIECSGLLEAVSKILRNNDVHHVDLFNEDSVFVESAVQFLHHLRSQF